MTDVRATLCSEKWRVRGNFSEKTDADPAIVWASGERLVR